MNSINTDNTDNHNEIKNALSDVRKAFRLLWAYNKRIFNIVKHIRNDFGFEHYYMGKLLGTTNSRSDFCEYWAWEALPLVTIGWTALRFNRNEDGSVLNRNGHPHYYPLAGEMLLHIFLISDSAFFDTMNGTNKNEPNAVNFPPPDQCQSKLVLSVYVNNVDRVESMNWFDEIFTPCFNASKWNDVGPNEQVVKEIRRYSTVLMLDDLLDEETLDKRIRLCKQEIQTQLGVNLNKVGEKL